MTTLTEYFEKRARPPRFHCGDRVFGHYKKIPFIGSVGVEHLVSEARGVEVVVNLDLPLRDGDQYLTIVTVRPRDLRPLVKFDDEPSTKPRRKR